MNLIDIFWMQGYGVYVWGSVLVTLGILIGNAGYAAYQLRCAVQEKKTS